MVRKWAAVKRARGNSSSARLRRRLPAFDLLESRLLLSGSALATPNFLHYVPGVTPAAHQSTTAVEMTPASMRQAYGINQISVNGIVGDGSGQTIALVDAFRDPTLASDLATFDADYNLAAPPTFTQIRQDGSLITASNQPPVDNVDPAGNSWAIETSLDVEWAHVIAPKANILVVLADDSGNGLYTAVSTAAHYAGVSAVSMSWGGSDLGGTDDSLFVAPGVTFLAATGDSGAYTTRGGALYPASSPNVLAVGGTTLYLSGGNYSSESAWADGGGGLSTVEAEPAYQKTVVPSSITTTQRALPDVSMDADPYSGVPVIDSYDFGSTAPEQYGGTSLATPMWAALIAITNQERVDAGMQTLNQTTTGPTATLPLIYGLPSTDFNDVTTGSNGHAATVGYDLATGRGTPIANKLVAGLVGAPVTPQPAIGSLTVSPTSITTSGSATLTANNVTDPGATITGVTFYLESNNVAGLQVGSDTTLTGTVTHSGNNWSTTLSGLATGSYTYYAVATDSASVSTPTGTSAPSATLTVTTPVPQPVIGSLTFNPSSVITGNSSTLTANNVTDAGATITGLAFYRETNGTAGLQVGSDTAITGTVTHSGNNWSISVSTAGLAIGTYTYYAVATDSANVSTATGTAAATATLGVVGAYSNLFTTDKDIGSPSPAGSASFNSTTGAYTVKGGGTDIGNKSDQFNYDYASYSGNGSIVAQVTSLTNTNATAKAGVMFRNSNATNAIFADVSATPGGSVVFEWRTGAGKSPSTTTVAGITGAVWVKLTRSGNVFKAYYATTSGAPASNNWIQIGSSETVAMSTAALAGLAVTSHSNGTLCTATFANVQLGLSTLVQPAGSGNRAFAGGQQVTIDGEDGPSAGDGNGGPHSGSLADSTAVPTAAVSNAGTMGDVVGSWAGLDTSDGTGALAAAVTNYFGDLVGCDAASLDGLSV